MEKPSDFDFEKKHPFKVPENYFQKLPVAIHERLPQKKPAFEFFPGGIKWAFSALIAVFIISFFIGKNNVSDSLDMDKYLAEVSDDAIQNYLESEYIATEEIIALSDASDIYDESLLPDIIEPTEVDFYEIEEALIIEYE